MAELLVNAGSKEICKTGIFLSMSVWQVETCMINERGKTCPLHSPHTYVEISHLKNDKKKKFKLLVLVSSLEYPPVAYTLSANCLFVHFLVYLCVCLFYLEINRIPKPSTYLSTHREEKC